jgi:UDP-glucose 6-dehydrogenase
VESVARTIAQCPHARWVKSTIVRYARNGESSRRSTNQLKCSILVTELSTAELTKHAANSFLALKISFR